MQNIYDYTISHHVAQISQYRANRVLPDSPELAVTSTAGRILSLRVHRNIIFFDLHEDGQFVQCAIRRSAAPVAFEYFEGNISRGNIVWISGTWGTTSSGEVTLFVDDIHLVSANLEMIGDLQEGFNNTGRDLRELDLMLNPQVTQRFMQRSRIIRAIREQLNGLDYMEVETPVIQTVASGSQATPFTTHVHATDTQAVLRIAPETYLVRLLAGGLSRIFEIGHSFRNEGISPRHNPEFCMIEFYETFSNMNQTIELTQEMLQNCMRVVHSDISQVPYGEHVLNFSEFGRYTVAQALVHFLGWTETDAFNQEYLRNYLATHNITNTMPSENVAWLQYMVFDNFVEHLLIQPTFITDLPIEASPLAYSRDGQTTRRFEMFCAGRELANGFEQVLSYDEQVTRFDFQATIAGRDNAMEADLQYLNTLRYGLPSLSGCGIGIDRLIMLATNTQHIRDVILYPL